MIWPTTPDRLAEVIGDRVVVDLADRALLGADAAGEVAEMVGRERHVGGHRLADRLAVVAGLDVRQQLEVLVDPVGDLVEQSRALGRRGQRPFDLGRMRRIERALDILGVGTGDLAQRAAIDRALVGKITPFTGAFHSPPMKLS